LALFEKVHTVSVTCFWHEYVGRVFVWSTFFSLSKIM